MEGRGGICPQGDPPAVRERVRSLANGSERPGASCARRRGRPRLGCGVSPLAPASCRRRGPRGRVRGCAGGYRPTGWGCDLVARAILVRRILDVPLDSGKFPGLASFALPRARLPFSARPQPAPGAPPTSLALVGSARGVDLIHRDRFEGGHVDAAFVEDRLHPLRGPSNAAPGLLGVLRVAVLPLRTGSDASRAVPSQTATAPSSLKGSVAEKGEMTPQALRSFFAYSRSRP